MIVFVEVGDRSINLSRALTVDAQTLRSLDDYPVFQVVIREEFRKSEPGMFQSPMPQIVIERGWAKAFHKFWQGQAVEHEDYTIVKIGPEITKYRLHLPATKGEVSDG